MQLKDTERSVTWRCCILPVHHRCATLYTCVKMATTSVSAINVDKIGKVATQVFLCKGPLLLHECIATHI